MGKYFKHAEQSFCQAFRTKNKCDGCGETNDVWLCLTCLGCFCSREGGGHGLKHYSETGHCVILSLVTLNFWCYAEECYLEHDFYPVLVPLFRKLHEIRHGEQPLQRVDTPQLLLPMLEEGEEAATCPHVKTSVRTSSALLAAAEGGELGEFHSMRCLECGNTDEAWLCLQCLQCHCGRFANKHMINHSQQTGHEICISCKDMSIWCHQCAAYLDTFQHPRLAKVFQSLYTLKQEQHPLPEALTSSKRFHDDLSAHAEWFNEYPVLLEEEEEDGDGDGDGGTRARD